MYKLKKIINYYYVFLELFILFMLCLEKNQFYFKGFLYHFIMIIVLLLTFFITYKISNTMKFKKIFYILLPIDALVISNPYIYILLIILIVEILVLNYRSKFICIVFGIVALICTLFFPIVVLLSIMRMYLISGDGNRLRSMAYDEEHYKCGEYEIFSYSGGAMDHMHYAVIKPNNVIKIGNALNIGYDDQVGDTLEDYNKIFNDKKCKKVRR